MLVITLVFDRGVTLVLWYISTVVNCLMPEKQVYSTADKRSSRIELYGKVCDRRKKKTKKKKKKRPKKESERRGKKTAKG